MTEQEFDKIVLDQLDRCKNILTVKAKEYRRNNNPMHNFDVGASITGKTREQVLDGFMLKHYISYRDMINDIEKGNLPTIELLEEKVTDILNYYILLKASIVDKINQKRDIDEKRGSKNEYTGYNRVLEHKQGVLQ